jgi:type 2 lantibiotic biosynthesis protein LanM
MRFSRELLAEIAAKASTLEERLSGSNLAPADGSDPALIEKRLQAWAERAAKGDREKLREFLALRDWNLDSIGSALGVVRLADPQQLPGWALLLEEFVAAYSVPAPGPVAFLDPAAPMPFEQIWAPFVQTAVTRLSSQEADGWTLLREPAQIMLERQLLFWLSHGSAEVLFQELSIFRSLRRSAERDSSIGEAPAENQALEAFSQHLQAGALIEIFRQYSALARAVAVAIDHWIGASAEFLRRLFADYDDLRKVFGKGVNPGKVADMKAGLSDPHHYGRTVAALKFDSDLKVVYKPKDVTTELAWLQMIEWVNEYSPVLKLRAMNVLPREAYGWIEYISHEKCSNEAEIERFYHRGGMLLAIFRALGSSDIHHENMIANGEFPIPVDAETMITPLLWNFEPSPEESADLLLLRAMDDSVLRSAMLPAWRPFQDVNTDFSGLGCVGGEDLNVSVWDNSYAGSANSSTVRVKTGRPSNTPFPDGDAFPARYTEQVVAGFSEMYALLRTNRDAFQCADGPLQRLAGSPMRLVFRETYIYFQLLKHSLDPKFLHDGVDRSIYLEALCRILFSPATRSAFLPMVLAEKDSLQNLDIPFFTIVPVKRGMYGTDKLLVDEYFPRAPIENVRTNIEHMGEADHDFQAAIIRSCFFCKALNQHSPIDDPDGIPDGPPASAEEFIEAARAIARKILSAAVRGGSDTASFFGLQVHPDDRLYRMGPLAPRLFDGTSGVLIFLSALRKAGYDVESEELCRRLMNTFKLAIHQLQNRHSWNRSYKGDIEAGLLVYPLLKIGCLANDATLIELAMELPDLITPHMLGGKFPVDVHGGLAGILLGLLALYKISPSDKILEKSVLCGRKLAAFNGNPSPGVSLALARLQCLSGDSSFLNGLSSASHPWCRGESGIGIAALADIERPGNDAILQKALSATLVEPLDSSDSLYSGVFARVAFWTDAARWLGRSDLRDAAIRAATQSLRRADRDGGFRIYLGLPPLAWGPGFFEGASGIGYELLRLACPEILPSVILWQ